MSDKTSLILTTALGLICLVILGTHGHLVDAAPFLDEGDHASTGRLLSHGAIMYKDAFNEKGPGLYLMTAGRRDATAFSCRGRPRFLFW